jgi:lysophospholipase L1-like esterase
VSRRRFQLRRLLYAALAVILGLALIEMGLRLAGYRPPPTRPVTRNQEILHQYTKFRPSPTLTWELVPGWSGREGAGAVVINSRGLRERELPLARPAGTRRILCLGDSVTFGHWVEAQQAFPRQLEQALAGRTGTPVQVINAGVPGYSSFQELKWLEEKGWEYQPDLIVVSFVLNDVVERYLTMAAYGGAHTILGVDTTVTLQPLSRLLRRTAFHRFVTSMMQGQARRREIYSVRRLFADPLPAEIEEAWQLTEGELSALAAVARARQVPLVLVAFPFRFQVQENLPPLPQQRLARWASAEEIPYVDLTGAFVALGPEAGFLDHDHPTPAGHRAAALEVAAALMAQQPAALCAAGGEEDRREP